MKRPVPVCYFGLSFFPGRLRGPRDAPRIVFFLGLRNSFERGLVGLLVDLRLLLVRLLVVVIYDKDNKQQGCETGYDERTGDKVISGEEMITLFTGGKGQRL